MNNQVDVNKIKEIYNQYCSYANAGELDNFLSIWDDNATRMEPDNPSFIGKENVRKFFEPSFGLFNINVAVYGEIEVQVSEDLAFSKGKYSLSLTPKEGGPETALDGKWLDILKRQTDGSWKIYIDMINLNAPPVVK